MSLVDLASNESGQIPYAVIRDTLQVDHLSIIALDMSPRRCGFNIFVSCRLMVMRSNIG